ncbi:hypothetical protein A3K81_03080 [Candidatus Bathyarchaeota archaeon RBG_13_60_20]|nr:MAG: hypothetical protein A3K81_03080 [Candidatus Bathyarchaeota archaeon RBG_13_60_20]
MRVLLPGGHVIKDTGMLPATWTKGAMSNVDGKLVLTNMRLIFTAGHGQQVLLPLRRTHTKQYFSGATTLH